jgi:hypothetical protein
MDLRAAVDCLIRSREVLKQIIERAKNLAKGVTVPRLSGRHTHQLVNERWLSKDLLNCFGFAQTLLTPLQLSWAFVHPLSRQALSTVLNAPPIGPSLYLLQLDTAAHRVGY